MKKQYIKGMIFTLLGGAFWGISGVCGQFLFKGGYMDAGFLVPIRLLVSGFILLLADILIYKKETFTLFKEKKNILSIILYAVFGIALCQYTYFVTIQLSDAGTATVLQYISPVIVLIWICFKEKRKPQIFEVISILLVLAGIILIATHGKPNELKISKTALFTGIISGIAVAFYNLQPQKMMKIHSTNIIIAWGMFIGGIILSLIMRPWRHSVILNRTSLAALIFIIIFGTLLGFSFYMYGVRCIGAVYATMISAVEPITATVVSALLLKTQFNFVQLIGFIFIISTIFIISFNKLTAKGNGKSNNA